MLHSCRESCSSSRAHETPGFLRSMAAWALASKKLRVSHSPSACSACGSNTKNQVPCVARGGCTRMGVAPKAILTTNRKELQSANPEASAELSGKPYFSCGFRRKSLCCLEGTFHDQSKRTPRTNRNVWPRLIENSGKLNRRAGDD